MADFFKKIYGFPFAAAAYSWLAVTGFFLYPYFYITGFREKQLRNFLYIQGKIVQFAVLWASGFRKTVIKRKLPESPAILVANHPSTYDTFIFFNFGIKNLICIAKGWPFKIPLYGKYIEKAGYINSDNKSAAEIIEAAGKKIEEGLNIAVFPEGTRNKEMGRFRSLAFEMSIRLEVPVIPFAIDGLDEMLPPGSYIPKIHPLKYIQLEPVLPDEFKVETGALKMAKYVKELIIKAIKEN